MKTSKIGELNFEKFNTQVFATENVKRSFKSSKASLATLIPVPWVWYDGELFDAIDENGDGKPDEKFGTEFKIIYLLENEESTIHEQDFLITSKTTIKNIRLKYIALKN